MCLKKSLETANKHAILYDSMDSKDQHNKIVRIRTFQSDADNARSLETIEEKSELPQDTPKITPEKNVPQVSIVEKPIEPKPPIVPSVSHKETIVRPPSLLENKVKPFVEKKQTDTQKYLQKEIETIARPEKQSILTDTEDTYDVGPVQSGTIIRDTKRKRFRLFPAMALAVSYWFKSAQDEYTRQKPPKYSVNKAEDRLAIIEKAVTQSERPPQDDSKEIIEHLKSIERTPITASITVKDKRELEMPSWQHLTEENAQSENNVTTENIETSAVTQTAFEQVPVVENAEVPQSVPEHILEEIKEIPKSADVITPPVVLVAQQPAIHHVLYEPVKQTAPVPKEVYEPVVETVIEEPAVNEVIEEPIVDEGIEEPIEQKIQEEPTVVEEYKYDTIYNVAPAVKPKRYAPPTENVSSFYIKVLIAVIGVSSLFGVGVAYYLFGGKTTENQLPPTVYQIPALIQAQIEVPIVLTSDRVQLLSTLLTETEVSDRTTQIYPTITAGENTYKPAPTQNILGVLAFRTSAGFNRSIQEIAFGATAEKEPFIVLKAESFDSAFAGMLAWEQSMSADLSPLFGDTVTETFDPQSRTDTQVRSAFFKDTIASNKNVRLLLDENGEDRLIYTFINQNTILITTTRDALKNLIPLIE